MSNVNFINSIKISLDIEDAKLFKLQRNIENKGITTNNVMELTKNLSNSEKNRLKQLYIEQIKSLNSKTQNCKEAILRIKKTITKAN